MLTRRSITATIFLVAVMFFDSDKNVGLAASPSTTALQQCEKLLVRYDDNFGRGDEIEQFWSIHSRFGILKHRGKFILIARSEALAQQVIADIAAWKESVNGKTTVSTDPIRTTVPEITVGVAFDITGILPDFARSLHWRAALQGNCWGVACYAGGLTKAIYNMEESEFTFLLSSPLARKLSSNDELRSGDLVAFRAQAASSTGGKEIHGAIYISENLVLSKNGAGEGFIRLQDAGEVVSQYRSKMDQDRIRLEFYRLTPLDVFIKQNESHISPELKEAIAKLHRIEVILGQRSLESELKLKGDEEKQAHLRYREQLAEAYRLTEELNTQTTRALQKVGEVQPGKGRAFPSETQAQTEHLLWTLIRNRLPALSIL